MKIIKKAASLILALTLALSFSVVVSAERKDYYIVSGTVYDDGTAYIESAEIVLGIEDAAGSGGYDYVIVAEDYDYNVIDSKSFSVKFTGYPDGIGTVSEVPFTVLIPYNEAIVNFSLYDSSDMRLWDFEVDNSIEVTEINITQTEDGFSLSWTGTEGLTYDLTAVSQNSGFRSVLLFKSENTYLEIPYEWLEPNDSVAFELAAYSGNGTLINLTDYYDTPDGEAAVFGDADGEEWAEGAGDIGNSESNDHTGGDVAIVFILIAVIGGILVVGVGVLILVIVLVTKKKKQ